MDQLSGTPNRAGEAPPLAAAVALAALAAQRQPGVAPRAYRVGAAAGGPLLGREAAAQALAALPKPVACAAALGPDGVLAVSTGPVPRGGGGGPAGVDALAVHQALAAHNAAFWRRAHGGEAAGEFLVHVRGAGTAFAVPAYVVEVFWRDYAIAPRGYAFHEPDAAARAVGAAAVLDLDVDAAVVAEGRAGRAGRLTWRCS